MKVIQRPDCIVLTIVISLAATSCACSLQGLIAPTETPTPTPTATATSTPTPTPTPTATATPTPTPTLTPSSTPTPEPTTRPKPRQGELVVVENGGFSFRTISGYRTSVAEASATISSADDEVVIALGIGPADGRTPEQVLEGYLNTVSEDIEGLQTSKAEPVTIDGAEGVAVDISGRLFGDEIEGRVAMARKGDMLFFAFGIGVLGSAGNRWEDEGAEAFEMVIDSVRFTEAGADAGPCPISSDPTYGYTMENAIRVGGDIFGGPARERAYLDNLRGPDGQTITYHRVGSTGYGDTILDIYEINYSGLAEPIVLYIDMYVFEELFAPVGFTCAGPFPLQAP